ncbi:acetate--CoA ligase family protein [Fervidicoccus fontis]|uniref:Acetyl-CoA synthetase n=1 Tax=Fervidicoccus fontis TaxID=683846 RepID=A0A2J6N348_9CREN|nr:CoA-binding protein [Fervidicoccus fontis]PMB75656.1 MAG: acetyl-CoA synthetase [Fervidicoccus fontis]PMB76576.1 MAG: acetyl-CoA synthetase [Fervidicoccus fontis]HEW63991.1 acetyl-CoA synthetase [Fervidicoccus fontis]
MNFDYRYFFEPKSIAVIGASNNETKLGHQVFKNLLSYKGKVFPVNVKEESIMGVKAYKTIKDIQDEIDLSVIVVPKPAVKQAVIESGEKGAKGIIIITAGFGETGERGKEEERELVRVAHDYGMRVIGPNCVGVMNTKIDLNATFIEKAKKGSVTFISQSGALGGGIVYKTIKENIGFAKFVSVGNMSDVDFSDLIEYFSRDPDTASILLYLEGVKSGKRFLEVLKEHSKEKPIIALKGGIYGTGARAVSSHTGSIAGNAEIFMTALKQGGAIKAKTIDEALSMARSFTQPLPKGKRVGVITNAGGAGVLISDLIEENGLEMSKLKDETISYLSSFLPPMASLKNPIDMIASATGNDYYRATKALLKDDDVDIIIESCVVPTFGGMTRTEHAEGIVKAINESEVKKPILAMFMAGDVSEDAKRFLESNGIPTYERPEDVVSAARALYSFSLISSKNR